MKNYDKVGDSKTAITYRNKMDCHNKNMAKWQMKLT